MRRPALALALLLAGCAGAPAAPDGTTTWTWKGERRIDRMVEIPAGVTLRILPGSVVRFAFVDRDGDGAGDAGIHVLGRIEAVGTPEQPILLASAEAGPQPGDWQGLLLDASHGNRFAHCGIEHAQHGIHAHFSSGTLERCRLERNVEGTRLGNSRFEIAHSLVRGNASKGLNFFACRNRIHHNLVTGNGDGIFIFETDTESTIEENNLLGNLRHDVRLGDFSRGGLRLRGNWWGTTDRAAIRARIWDGEDDPALGRVAIEPATRPVETGWEAVAGSPRGEPGSGARPAAH